MDYLSATDRGSLVVDYLGVSESHLADAVKRLIADGNYELAAEVLDWTRGRFPGSRPLAELDRQVAFRLMEKYQGYSPFKYILYSGRMSRATSAAPSK